MSVPKLVDKIYFEDGITCLSASHDGKRLAVGTKGLLGLYKVNKNGNANCLAHEASFVIPGNQDHAITHIFFTENDTRLSLRTEDGVDRELSLQVRVEGMLPEVSCTQSRQAA